MEIVGVMHSGKLVDAVDNYIMRQNPEGVSSIMLELPPNDDFFKKSQNTGDGFFEELAWRYHRRGTRVIFSDVARRNYWSLSPHAWFQFVEQRVPNRIAKIARFIDELVSVPEILINLLGPERDKGIVGEIMSTDPEVVVVGAVHAAYLKKVFEGAHYTYLKPPLYWPENWLGNYLLDTVAARLQILYVNNADQVVSL